jgi:ring-1,2-phenylacetyl-CoA epoxidase subunit PaaD
MATRNDAHTVTESASELRLARLRAAVEAVPDPELPLLTIGELGIVREVRFALGAVIEVRLTPTYLGCPATEAISEAALDALVAAGCPRDRARVVTVLAPAWTTDWINAEGRRKLARHGIAPPGPASGGEPVDVELGLRCPHCGSTRTRLLSRFGPTACQALRVCVECAEPFGHVKPV